MLRQILRSAQADFTDDCQGECVCVYSQIFFISLYPYSEIFQDMSYTSKTELTASRNCSSIKHSWRIQKNCSVTHQKKVALPREMPSSLGCGELAVPKHFETQSGLWECVWLPQQSCSRPEPRKPAVATLAKVGIFPAWATGKRLCGSFRHCPSITGRADVLWTLGSSLGWT